MSKKEFVSLFLYQKQIWRFQYNRYCLHFARLEQKPYSQWQGQPLLIIRKLGYIHELIPRDNINGISRQSNIPAHAWAYCAPPNWAATPTPYTAACLTICWYCACENCNEYNNGIDNDFQISIAFVRVYTPTRDHANYWPFVARIRYGRQSSLDRKTQSNRQRRIVPTGDRPLAAKDPTDYTREYQNNDKTL